MKIGKILGKRISWARGQYIQVAGVQKEGEGKGWKGTPYRRGENTAARTSDADNVQATLNKKTNTQWSKGQCEHLQEGTWAGACHQPRRQGVLQPQWDTTTHLPTSQPPPAACPLNTWTFLMRSLPTGFLVCNEMFWHLHNPVNQYFPNDHHDVTKSCMCKRWKVDQRVLR